MAKSANFYQKYTFFHLTRGSFGFYFWRMRRTQNLSFFILYFSPPSVLLFLFLFNYWFVCLFAINFVPRALFPSNVERAGEAPFSVLFLLLFSYVGATLTRVFLLAVALSCHGLRFV